MSSVQGGAVVKSASYVELTPAEQAAARKALAGLGMDDLLTGDGSDTFAGGSAQPGSFVAAFASDSVSGGNVFMPGAQIGVALSADPFGLAGPTVHGVANDPAAQGAGQVVTFSDQTTINLIGVTNGPGSTSH
jgi:hypothetical protein